MGRQIRTFHERRRLVQTRADMKLLVRANHRIPCPWRLATIFVSALAVFASLPDASAGTIWLPGMEGVSVVEVDSVRERKFSEVVKQQYDFSCGSAALATLLTYHYDWPTDERTAFGEMWAAGDQDKITAAGFSLLDMKRYLDTIGFAADGYQASLDKLADAAIPAIALINHRGYRHFVVVKGIRNGEVLIGDPALGLKTMSRDEFNSIWDNGILFIIKNRPELGRSQFNTEVAWHKLARAPLSSALSNESLASLTVALPRLGDF